MLDLVVELAVDVVGAAVVEVVDVEVDVVGAAVVEVVDVEVDVVELDTGVEVAAISSRGATDTAEPAVLHDAAIMASTASAAFPEITMTENVTGRRRPVEGAAEVAR